MSVEEMFAKLQSADEGELKELKLWLFRENIRLESAKQNFEKDRENKARKITMDEELIAQKFAAIKKGFDELDRDRQVLKSQEASLRTQEAALNDRINSYSPMCDEVTDMLFCGVNNEIVLKKRYKDLMKIYHPDCMGGDAEMVKAINKAYDRQLKEYDIYDIRRRA